MNTSHSTGNKSKFKGSRYRHLANRVATPVEALISAARLDFLSFAQLCFHILSPSEPIMMNWHIKAIAHELDQVRLGNQNRLMISLPPRHLKSIMASVIYPAFLLGHNPSQRIIVASYGRELSIKHSNDFRAIIESSMFRAVFPHFQISGRKNTEIEITTTAGGFRYATSVDGPLTGRGANTIIIDDPLKSTDSNSPVKRENVNTWYKQALLSRLDSPRLASIILVMQRLHANDLAGMLLESNELWRCIKLPAVATSDEKIKIGDGEYYHRKQGEVLHDAHAPLDYLISMKEKLGSDIFQAQYQQDPVPPGGYMIQRPWIRRYDALPARKSGSMIIQSVDTAIKAGPNNDYSVITTWLLQDHIFYLMDVARERLEYPGLKQWVCANAYKHKPNKILIEDSGTGSALIAELRFSPYRVVGVRVKDDKVTRMQIAAAKFESGKVMLPRNAHWLADLETELFSFPQSKHDDQIDSISQALTVEIPTYNLEALNEGLARMFFSRPNFRVIY